MSAPIRDEGDYQSHPLRKSSEMIVNAGQALGGESSDDHRKNMTISPKFANSSNPLQRKSFDMPSKKNLQKMLQASHLKAMEIMLKGVNTSECAIYAPDRIGIHNHLPYV